MDARPLKDIFADLVGDATARADAIPGAGHDLPPELLTEAVVSFAATAPAEVAEHLAPFVTANSGVPVGTDAAGDPPDWTDLFATAPVLAPEEDDDLDAPAAAPDDVPAEDQLDLDFGGGAGDPGDAVSTVLDAITEAADDVAGPGAPDVDDVPLDDDLDAQTGLGPAPTLDDATNEDLDDLDHLDGLDLDS